MSVLASQNKLLSITDDIIAVGYKPDHSDNDQAFTSLLQAAQKCNVKLKKLQYKQDEVDFLWWDLYYKWSQTCQKQSVSYNSHAFTNQQESSSVIHWHD